MGMRKLFILVFSLAISVISLAQNNRAVNGAVFDKNGLPLANAVVKGVGVDSETKVAQNGTFVINVPFYCKCLEASCDGYYAGQIEIDGSYLVFKLKVDKNYAVKKAEEEAVKAENLRIQAEQIAAAEAAKREAEAEQQRRLQEEQRRLEEEQKRAEMARLKEQQRKEQAEARAALALQKKQDRAAGMTIEYRNRGWIHSAELQMNGNMMSVPSCIFLGLKYLFGYRFSNAVALSLGTGLEYNLTDYESSYINPHLDGYRQDPSTIFDVSYESYDYYHVQIPLYLNGKFFFSKGKVQPFASVSLGVYLLPLLCPKTELGFGVNFRLSSRANLYAALSVDTEPFPAISTNFSHSFDGNGSRVTGSYRVHSQPDFLCPTFRVGYMF